MKTSLQKILTQMADRWPSAFVARKRIDEFTGGLVSPKTMANRDSLGEGPPRCKLGRNVGYLKAELVDWLKNRIVLER